MNEILKQSFEQKPFIDNLPEANIDINKSITTGMSALAVAGVGATGASLSNPERADAVAETCTAPLNETITPNPVPPAVNSPDFSVSSIAMSNNACIGLSTTYTTEIRDVGTNSGNTLKGFKLYISGRKGFVDGIKELNFTEYGLDGTPYTERWLVSRGSKQISGKKVCHQTDFDYDKDGKTTSSLSCSDIFSWSRDKVEVSFENSIQTPSKTGNDYVGVRIQEGFGDWGKGENNSSIRDIQAYNHDGTPAKPGTSNYNPGTEKCPTRPNFNAIYNKSSNTTSFYYKAKPGQVIKANTSLKQLDTPAGRSKMSRVEYVPAGKVDPKKLPKHARKVGNKIVVALTKNANSSAYQGLKMKYPPKKGTFAKLILPNSPKSVTYTKSANNKNCVSSYPTIYAQNLIGK